MKRFAISIVCGLAVAMLLGAVAYADPPNLSGLWKIQQSGLNGTTGGTITIQQSGTGLVGQNAGNGNGFTGEFVNDGQINGKWHGPGGAGWITVYVSPNGHSFNGTWGYNGRPANGSFVGNKVLPPSPITAAGTWKVAVAGNANQSFTGLMRCTQSGKAAVCRINNVAINGAFVTRDKIRAKWVSSGRAGWFSFWFNGDNNSFNGTYGLGPDTSKPEGRVIGQRAL